MNINSEVSILEFLNLLLENGDSCESRVLNTGCDEVCYFICDECNYCDCDSYCADCDWEYNN